MFSSGQVIPQITQKLGDILVQNWEDVALETRPCCNSIELVKHVFRDMEVKNVLSIILSVCTINRFLGCL